MTNARSPRAFTTVSILRCSAFITWFAVVVMFFGALLVVFVLRVLRGCRRVFMGRARSLGGLVQTPCVMHIFHIGRDELAPSIHTFVRVPFLFTRFGETLADARGRLVSDQFYHFVRRAGL